MPAGSGLGDPPPAHISTVPRETPALGSRLSVTPRQYRLSETPRQYRTCHEDGVAETGELVDRRRHGRVGRQAQTAGQRRLGRRLQRAVGRHPRRLAAQLRPQLPAGGVRGQRSKVMVARFQVFGGRMRKFSRLPTGQAV